MQRSTLGVAGIGIVGDGAVGNVFENEGAPLGGPKYRSLESVGSIELQGSRGLLKRDVFRRSAVQFDRAAFPKIFRMGVFVVNEDAADLDAACARNGAFSTRSSTPDESSVFVTVTRISPLLTIGLSTVPVPPRRPAASIVRSDDLKMASSASAREP